MPLGLKRRVGRKRKPHSVLGVAMFSSYEEWPRSLKRGARRTYTHVATSPDVAKAVDDVEGMH